MASVVDESALYVTDSLAVRDALIRDGAHAVYRWSGAPEPDLPACRTLALPTGTLFLDQDRFDGPDHWATLSPQQSGLVGILADGAWHQPDELERALFGGQGPRARLDSAIARLRKSLGGSVDSAYGGGWRLRQVGARRPAPTLLDLLGADAPVDPTTLARQLGCTAGALRARIHRLRRSGVPIDRAPTGYVLANEQESLRQAVLDALRAHRVVNLWGPLGVGKTTLLRELAGGREIHLDGLSPETVRRRLKALASCSPQIAYLDGLDPAAASALGELSDRPILFTSRTAVPGVAQVAYAPWTATRLGRVFPGCDTADWDGLPLGACSDAAILARLPREPALRAAAREPGPLHPASLGPVADRFRSLGLLVDPRHPRLVGPVLRALRSTFEDADWVALSEGLVRRMRDLFWQQELRADSAIVRNGLEVLDLLMRRGLPASQLAMVLTDAEALDAAPLAALAAQPGPDRPDLLYRLWLHGLGDHLIHEAIAEADAPDRYDLMVQLAHDLFPRDPDASERLFHEVRNWLDRFAPHEHVWVRNEWLISIALRQPRRIAPEALIEQLVALERARFGHPFQKLQWARVNCLWALGLCALVRNDLDTAVNALEEVVGRMGERSVLHGGLELVRAYARRGDWALADAYCARVADFPLNDAWDGYRRGVHTQLLLAQGRSPEARIVAATLDPAHPTLGFVPALIAALDGRDPASAAPHREALERVARAARSGLEADIDAVRGLRTEKQYSGPELVRMLQVHR